MPVAQLDPDVDPWERQPQETSKAFDAFATYRDMGQQRALRRAAARIGKGRELLRDWSVRWRWQERVLAWDRHQDTIRRQAAAKALADMHERHAKIAAAFTGKVIERLNSLRIDELTPANCAHWFDVAVKVERVARGDVSDRAGVEHSGPGGDPIEVDFVQMTPEQRREAVLQMAETAARRARAAAGVFDDEE